MSHFNTIPFMTVVGALGAIALTVLTLVFIIPEKKRAGLNKVFAWLHDVLNFKTLFIEKILKALYALCTFACIAIGACWMFGIEIYRYSGYNDYYADEFNWMGGWGILLMILGPIAVRIAYEIIMMFILLVKNTIEINNKMKSENNEPAPAIKETVPIAAEAPVEETAPIE